ncbi:MAG: LLM class flavin-dependent oxidoreductase [Chloroflexi bacterium]|nr:MAG: LLM class flavin-dependent oxidoreductase [Chloroflexota bacterium]
MKVGVTLPATIADAGGFIADVRALEAAGADMIGVAGDSPEHWVLLGAVAALTERVRLRVSSQEPAVLGTLSRGRLVVGEPEGETWTEVPMPADRDSWTAMLRDHETAGATGVIVPWDPRLIDLLRNPEADDRGDLLMSTG